ncbi:MAG: class I SAM-dependent methyltransferase [Promethearchaeota archaeon]
MKKRTSSTIYHDKIAEDYESSYLEPYWQLYFEITWQNLKKYLPKKGARILDAGGGTGYWSRKLAKHDFYMVCSDISERMLEVGSKLAEKENLQKLIEFEYADITDMHCFEDNSFDMVLAQGDPVGYCGNPQKAIQELSRVAKTGASVSVSVDSYFSQLGRQLSVNNYKQIEVLKETHISDERGEFPIYYFTVDELRKMFNKSGLKVIDTIGKCVFTRFFSRDKINEFLSDQKFFDQLFELEMSYNSDLSIVGLCRHIQMIGKKK